MTNALTILSDTYERVDADVRGHLAVLAKDLGREPTCKRGCTACCRILTSISVAEAVAVAEWLLDNDPRWRDRLPALRRAALADDAEGLTNASRARDGTPCGLLDASGDCAAYPARPAACRFHLSFSPAEWCDAEKNPGHRIQSPDLTPAETAVWTVAARVSEALGSQRWMQAPVSLLVLHALLAVLFERGPLSDLALVGVAVDGLPEPEEWVARHAEDLVAEGDAEAANNPEVAAQRERLMEMGRKIFKPSGTT